MRQVGARRSIHVPPRCPEARLPQIQPAGEQERLKGAMGLRQAVLRKHTPGSGTVVPMVETGECGDVGTRVWPHSDGTCLVAELRYNGIVAHQHESGFKYGHNFAHTLYQIKASTYI